MTLGSLVKCQSPVVEEHGWMGLVVELETCKLTGNAGFWVCYFGEPDQWRWYRPEDNEVEVVSEAKSKLIAQIREYKERNESR